MFTRDQPRRCVKEDPRVSLRRPTTTFYMFGIQDSIQPRGPLTNLKEEPLSSQLGTVRNWMQPSVVDQNSTTRCVQFIPPVKSTSLVAALMVNYINARPIALGSRSPLPTHVILINSSSAIYLAAYVEGLVGVRGA